MNKVLKAMVLLFFLMLLISQSSNSFAKDRSHDLFTNVNKENHYRYYSSPKGSAYVDRLPAQYMHIITSNAQDIDPQNVNIGDEVSFKVTQETRINDKLILTPGTIISGKFTEVKKPKRLIRNGVIKVDFDKVVFPGGYELSLNNDTFTVMPLIAKKGSRYELAKEVGYLVLFSGAKYPIARYTSTPISVAIAGGAGLVGGFAYGLLTDNVKKDTIFGILRGVGGKTPISIIFMTGKSFVMKQGDHIILTIYTGNASNMLDLPQYLNIENRINVAH